MHWEEHLAVPLHDHQREAVEFLEGHPRAILADDVGLGKTFSALGYLALLRERGELVPERGHALWITSANLIEQTEREARRLLPGFDVFTQNDPLYSNQTPAKRLRMEALYPNGPCLVIVSHEHASARASALHYRFGKPAVVVIDEAMALKNHLGKRHTKIRELAGSVPRVLAMTATPFENDLMETFALLRVIHVEGLKDNGWFGRFIEWSEAIDIPHLGLYIPEKPVGVRLDTLPELRGYLSRFMLRRMAGDVGLPLPVHVGERHQWVPISAAQEEAYQAGAKIGGGVGWVKQTQAGRGVGEESVLVDEFIRQVRGDFHGEKVIAYCETLDVLSSLAARLDESGIGHRVIEGVTRPNARAKALADFRDDPSVHVLIGSRVLELGLNIQHCRNLISLDCSDNPQREAQREGRIRRVGSPHATYRHLTLMPDTPTARKKVQSLQTKAANADLVLGAPAPSFN